MLVGWRHWPSDMYQVSPKNQTRANQTLQNRMVNSLSSTETTSYPPELRITLVVFLCKTVFLCWCLGGSFSYFLGWSRPLWQCLGNVALQTALGKSPTHSTPDRLVENGRLFFLLAYSFSQGPWLLFQGCVSCNLLASHCLSFPAACLFFSLQLEIGNLAMGLGRCPEVYKWRSI